MVGVALCKLLEEKKVKTITPSRYQLNIGNFDQVMKYSDLSITHIIHLSAETDHEYCDLNPSNCYYINTIGTENMVLLAKKIDVPIVHLSAGSIFDGEKRRPYIKTDEPNPINHYNRSKYLAEILVRDYKKHYILRAGWMFGGGPSVDKKFVNKIMNKILNGEKNIKVCDDCIGSPTYTNDLASCIFSIIENRIQYGTYHSVNRNEGVSRYEFAQEIIKNIRRKVKIIPCSIDDLKDEFPCKRTNYEVLKSDFEYNMRDWRKALKEYVHEFYRR